MRLQYLYNKFFFPLLFMLASGNVFCQVINTPILNNWQFREQDEIKWHQAIVPGEVHTDLQRNKLIPDPFYRDNEKKLQWIEKENWEYRTTFSVSKKSLDKKSIDLVFDGLDTYANVYLNGILVLKANNMFRQWVIPVKNHLKPAGNELLILFRSAQNIADSFAKADIPYVIPDNPRAYIRKAQYHFGWDWGPKLTGCGIWKPVRLEAYDIKPTEEKFTPPVKVELVQSKDDKGKSFYFNIDGKPVYMKGANYIPSDAFVTRVTKDDYRKILMMAKDANMNMLRVWGGGIYEDDYFYDLCDSLGIYVWQDFMFAGSMIPGDDAFFANVKEEVKYQVKRLRHHKSIVLWCGNNEIEEAFFRWGWQTAFRISPKDSTKLLHDYNRLFSDSIPIWLKEIDTSRPYVSTSPQLPWGDSNSIKQGDSHYWGVWWGVEDFEVFEKKTGRFVSEYGIQAMPNYSSILAITEPQDRYLFSNVLQHHQRAGNGFNKLDVYLKNYFIDTASIRYLSIENYIYLTQCLQYYGFKNMIAIHRSKEPYNMGTLLWQLNDCWPVASWSITDYYNRSPKAAWYAVKEAYRNDVQPERDSIRPKELKLTNPDITWKIQDNKIIINAHAFAKYVYVNINGYTSTLSDNYFDLKAGATKVISFDAKEMKNKKMIVSIKSLYDVLQRK